MRSELADLFFRKIAIDKNLILSKGLIVSQKNQKQTQDVFHEKWESFEKIKEKEIMYKFQKDWFLNLYGFNSEDDLKTFLKDKNVIVDTGCGLGYKAAWFASLAPHAKVIGIDISESILIAAKNYSSKENLFFYQCDIADIGIKDNSVDFMVCDQVIMHTENPNKTFAHLAKITSIQGEFACYVYRKKALPRELLDDHFRTATHDISNEQLWEMSSQLTELGKRLSELKITFDSPDIPLLGIKGGKQDLQRFIYWNFIKCFWRQEWGKEMCDATNFDWYAPSNAKRFLKEEFLILAKNSQMITTHFHEEESNYSARFKHEN